MNDLSLIVPKLLAQGLLALRGAGVMPRLVNADYSHLAAQPGANIDVPIPSAITAQAVTPSAASPETRDIAPETATIRLDRWMEAPFYLSDKDLLEVERGIIPMQAGEAVKGIANDVNACLLDLGRKFYGFVGTPGVTPFATVRDATDARKVLNRQLAPIGDRRIVLDPDAEAAALGLSGFADVSKSGDVRPIIDGTIGRKYGFDWAMDQQVPAFESSVMTEGALTVNGGHEAGLVKPDSATTQTDATGKLIVKDVAVGGNVGDLASARGQIGDTSNLPSSGFDLDTAQTDGIYGFRGAEAINNLTKGWCTLFVNSGFHNSESHLHRETRCEIAIDRLFNFQRSLKNDGTWTPWSTYITTMNIGDGITTNSYPSPSTKALPPQPPPFPASFLPQPPGNRTKCFQARGRG